MASSAPSLLSPNCGQPFPNLKQICIFTLTDLIKQGINTRTHRQLCAQVAELVDAQASGACGRKVVEVRVFSWAPLNIVKSITYAKISQVRLFQPLELD